MDLDKLLHLSETEFLICTMGMMAFASAVTVGIQGDDVALSEALDPVLSI